MTKKSNFFNAKSLFTLISWVFFLLLISSLFVFVFRVRKISCQIINQPQEKADQLCEKLVVIKNKSLFFFDFEQAPLVKEALFNQETQEAFFVKEISKSLSGNINYVFTTRPPLYRLIYGDEKWLVTMEGKLIKNDDFISVAEVVLADKALLFNEEDQLYSHREEFLRQLLGPLQQEDLKIEGMVADSLERVVLNIEGLPSVILDFSQDGAEQARRLKAIFQGLDQFKEGETKLDIREIDMRFELPIMRTYREVEIEVKLEPANEATGEAEILIDSPGENLL